MTKWLFIGLGLAGFAAGCSNECDLAEQLDMRAGSGAVDCGYVRLGEPSTQVDTCVRDAFTAKHPFFARYDRQGTDSKVMFGISQDAAGTLSFFTWDSDPSGGGGTDPVINGSACVGPSLLTDAQANEMGSLFACEHEESLGMTCQ